MASHLYRIGRNTQLKFTCCYEAGFWGSCTLDVLTLRQFVDGFSRQKPWFILRQVHEGSTVYEVALGFLFLPVIQISPISIIPPLLYTHSFTYHPRCIVFFSQSFSSPYLYHSTIAPKSFIHLPTTLKNAFLPVFQFSLSVSFHHCSILIHFSYHPRCIMIFSQYFSLHLSVSFHHCSILIHSSNTQAI